MPSELRRATFDDVAVVGDLLEEMHEENGLVAMDRIKVAHALLNAISQNRCLVVQNEKGRVIATAAYDVGPMWYSSAVVLKDLWIFVSRKYRDMKVARMLLDALKEDAAHLGITALVGVVSPVDTERKFTLFKRVFGKPLGMIWRIN